MSIMLASIYSPDAIEDIDAELDRFNDSLGANGYSASVDLTPWGERRIEVVLPEGSTTEFIENLDGFISYRVATEQLVMETYADRNRGGLWANGGRRIELSKYQQWKRWERLAVDYGIDVMRGVRTA